MNLQDQNSSPSNDELIISTEEGKTKREFYGAMGFFFIMISFIIALPWLPFFGKYLDLPNDRPFTWSVAMAALLIPVFFWILLIWHKRRGTWHIGSQGVKFTPLRKPPLFIRWNEVKRVKWIYGDIRLESEKETIRIGYAHRGEKQYRQAKERIERELSPYFDLAIKPVYKAKGRSRLISTLFLLGRGIVLGTVGFGALWLGVLTISHFKEELGDMAKPVLMIWFYGFFLVLLLVGVIITRKERKLNPVWRERIKDKNSRTENPETDT